jgi:hypothetical protein
MWYVDTFLGEDMKDDTARFVIKSKIKKIIYETLREVNLFEVMTLFEAECVLTVTGGRNITDVFTDIRAIEGVTIVSVIPGYGHEESPGITADVARVKVKFIKGKYSLRHRAAELMNKIGKIESVIGLKFVRTKVVEA